MSFSMVGIGPSDQQAVLSLSSRVVPSLRQVSALVKAGKADAESEMWFGDSSKPWLARLSATLNRMASVVNMETITVKFRSLQHRKGSFAAALRPKSGWGTYTDVKSARGQQFTLQLDTKWNSAPLLRTRTQLDSQFQTFVHEITHMLLDTDDIAYGQRSCRMLAKSSPHKAKNNADNWGYFVEECVWVAAGGRAKNNEVDLDGVAGLFD